jgi:Bacterial TSP3 repeat
MGETTICQGQAEYTLSGPRLSLKVVAMQLLPFEAISHRRERGQSWIAGRLLPLLVVIAILPCRAGTAPATSAVQRIFDVATITLAAELTVNLSAARSHRFELRDFAPQSDPVLHVLDSRSVQIGAATPRHGKLVLSLPGETAGDFLVVVRSQSAKAQQTGSLWIDGKLHTSQVNFAAGEMLRMPRLRAGEQVVAVRPPQGAASHVAYLLSADGLRILRRAAGTHTTLLPPVVGDAIVVYAARSNGVTGPLRVYRNDADADTDGDGLGDELENALGTCASKQSSVAGVNCNEIADTRDTDGDGLQDGWEVLGKQAVDGQGNSVYLDLPTWGANPRHKDVFVEVDFRRSSLLENQQGLVVHMQPAVARQMAAIYGDTATTDFWLRAAHAVSVDNPDRLPGISLHLDTGVPPERPEDGTIYGDWGGYNAVDAVPDPDHPGSYIPQNAEDVWTQQMNPARRGVFHYVLAYTSGGGACGTGIACGFNMTDPGNSAHEFGHTFSLNHNGPSGIDEPNCKPNYPSLMNYAYLYTGMLQFSDGRNFPDLNNHSLQETNAINPGNQALLNTLENWFQYKVDHASGSVDWNRDGVFSPGGTTVRAYANYEPGDDCEFTRENQKDTGLRSTLSPAIVRLNGSIWIFAVDTGGRLAYASTLPWDCSPDVDLCPVPKFGAGGTQDVGPLASMDAKTTVVNGMKMIVVVGIRPDGSMFETYFAFDGTGAQVWGPISPIATSVPAAGEPSLANSHDERTLTLAYKGTDNVVRIRTRTVQGWSAEQEVMVGGQTLAVYGSSSPAVAYAYLPIGIVVGQEQLIGAFPDAQGYVQLYTPQGIRHQWGQIPISYDSMYSAVGRPVLAWTGATGEVLTTGTPPDTSQPLTAGRFYILFLQYQSPPPNFPTPINPVRMAVSYVNRFDGSFRIGLVSNFDNVWSYAYGMSLLTPAGVNLRAAETYSIPKPESLMTVQFRPHADGMTDLTYHNYDDWKTLGWASCAVLVKTQASPVQCAPPW